MSCVLLTGATGFLGYRALERLVLEPDISRIIAVGRTLKPTHTFFHPKVEYKLGSLDELAFVQSLWNEPIQYIIHAAALSSPWGDKLSFEKANVYTQQNLLLLAKKVDVFRYVYISTPSVYFTGSDRWNIKESDPLPSQLVNEYARTKYRAELLLKDSGLPHVMLRPRALIGRADTVIMPRMIRAFDEGKLKIIGDGKNKVDLTSVANVADAIVASMRAEGKALNEVYNISNGEPVLLWDHIRLVLSLLNRKLSDKKVPHELVLAFAAFLELKAKWGSGAEPALTKYSVGTLSKNFTMDISKAKDLLGYVPKVSTEQALVEFTQWYLTNEQG